MCNPPKSDIIDKVVHFIKEKQLEALYIATDNDPMIVEFREALEPYKVSAWIPPKHIEAIPKK